MRKNTKRTKTNRKSLKGNWGHIGAPPKPMRWPGRPFVMASLFAFNPTLCELTVRKNVDKAVEAGELIALKPLPQKGGAVGRPKSRFVIKSKFVASKMELAPVKTVTVTPSVTVTATPAPVTVPTPAPVVETVAVEAPATPAPVIETPATPVVEAPATPAVIEAPAAPAPVAEIPATPITETPAVS